MDLLQRTLREIENIPCWLLVADIRGFTPLTRQMQSEDLEVLVGAWIFTCKGIMESRDGIVNKYLGDGFLAYWPEAGTSAEEIVAVIFALKDLQQKNYRSSASSSISAPSRSEGLRRWARKV